MLLRRHNTCHVRSKLFLMGRKQPYAHSVRKEKTRSWQEYEIEKNNDYIINRNSFCFFDM
jgi:hypothetical protein